MIDIGAVTDATCDSDDGGPLTLLVEGDDGECRFHVADVAGAKRLLRALEPLVDLVNAHDTAKAAYLAMHPSDRALELGTRLAERARERHPDAYGAHVDRLAALDDRKKTRESV